MPDLGLELFAPTTGAFIEKLGAPDAGRCVGADASGMAGDGGGGATTTTAAAGATGVLGAVAVVFCGSAPAAGLVVVVFGMLAAGAPFFSTPLTGVPGVPGPTGGDGIATGSPAAAAGIAAESDVFFAPIDGPPGLRPVEDWLFFPCCLAIGALCVGHEYLPTVAFSMNNPRPLRDRAVGTTLGGMPMYSIPIGGAFEPQVQQEWLLTNGLGSFAASTLVGMNARRYHGLLVATTQPPLGRVMALNRVGEILTLDGRRDQPHELSVNAFFNSIHPQGYQYLQQFELQTTARWTYVVDGVTVVKELLLPRQKNVAALRYTVTAGPRDFELALLPFVSLRDFHSLRHESEASFVTESDARRVTIRQQSLAVTLAADAGSFEQAPSWWYHHKYPLETERGQDDDEDLYTPGRFVLGGSVTPATGTASITLWIGLAAEPPGDWDTEVRAAQSDRLRGTVDPENAITKTARPLDTRSGVIRKLIRAADDFVVARTTPQGNPGTTIMAGYPWFSDWGRDTMISLPGLLLVPRRFDEAKAVLGVFATYVSQGMIPNRFDDYTNEPEYNTVDASLWFIHAAFEYRRLSGDAATFDQTLRPACQQILDGYRAGTRYFIKVDPADGLVRQGDMQTQLTWMDAKCDGIAFTPRQGKPVEINALWYHALVLMGQTAEAARVAESFRTVFWIGPMQGLADVVDGDRRDEAVRPNQIFAVSLPNSPLLPLQQSAVVDVVRRELLTPMGLRTLSASDPNYRGRYTGPQFQRDGAYHNGTVWPWLIGAFLEAHLRVKQNSPAAQREARGWLAPLIQHMADSGAIGQIAEIFEGDEPHRPVGCFAQAWSIAEVLRLASELRM